MPDAYYYNAAGAAKEMGIASGRGSNCSSPRRAYPGRT